MPTEAQIIAGLERRRQGRFDGLRRVERYLNGITETTTFEEISVRLELIEKFYVQFNEFEDTLTNYNVQSVLEQFEETYLQLKVRLKNEAASRNLVSKEVEAQVIAAVGRIAEHKLDVTIDRSLNTTQELRFPRINIPKFGGSYRDFPSFRDLFEASVHNNDNLLVAHKFHYLKGVLIDDAAELIKHMQLTDANYALAWNKIVERYDKKRHIVAELIQSCLQQTATSGKDGSLRRLCDKTDEVLRGLKALGKGGESRDPWIIQLLLPKLPNDLRHRWAISSADKDFPTVEEFLKFLNGQSDAIETCQAEANISANFQPSNHRQHARCNNLVSTNNCLRCDGDHSIYQCSEFRNLTRDAKFQFLKSKGACFNCLSRSHMKDTCRSKATCRICGQQHHTLLHDEDYHKSNHSNNNFNLTEGTLEDGAAIDKSVINGHLASKHNITLLPTAQVIIKDAFGHKVKARVLLDSGSQASFIDEALVQKLGLRRSHARIQVSGLATNRLITRGAVKLTLSSRDTQSSENIPVQAYVLNKMVTIRPQAINMNKNDFNRLSSLFLADPEFNTADQVDILIGADYFFSIISGERDTLTCGINMINSMFGWVLAGTSVGSNELGVNSFHLDCDLDITLKRFWETKSIPKQQMLNDTERMAVDYFDNTCAVGDDGRFVVSLPFRDVVLSSDCYNVAYKRFLAIERKLNLNETLRTEYVKFMEEYADLGHMELANDDDDLTRAGVKQYFLPHHAVFKDDGLQKKIRVVFDGSVKASQSGISFNDALLVGPTVQPSLWSTLIRFRRHAIPIVADIEKMYRQIWIKPSDRKFQKILWRSCPSEPVKVYQLQTVTYGTSCAPYLAVAALQKLGKSIREVNPAISRVILEDFYVDDLITGANTIDEAISLKRDIQHMLKMRGFNLRKMASSHPKLVEVAESDQTEVILDNELTHRKILGVIWKPKYDSFSFNVSIKEHGILTKRAFISQSAQIFDPFGFLSPVTIMAKILFQRLWSMRVDWDDEVPSEVADTWLKIKTQLPGMTEVNISRHISIGTARIKEIQLHGFSDASENAYAAVIYTRVLTENELVTVRLLASKTKVAPLNQVTLPRLELCGALLLSQLMSQVIESFESKNVNVFAWTDSTIVLAWLSDIPRRWKSYIGNRTSSILEVIPASKWKHVTSGDNPADHATRGLYPEELLRTEQWWCGPTWLIQDDSHWPNGTVDAKTITEAEGEAKRIKLSFALTTDEDHVLTLIISKVSSWSKLLRIISYLRRWLPMNRFKSAITAAELNQTEIVVVKHIQYTSFETELQALRHQRTISSKSKIVSLSPMVDDNGILRVGGRLQNSPLEHDQKHPIIIPKSSIISRLIVVHFNGLNLHAGPSLLSHLIRNKFWLIGVKSIAKDVSRKCIICVRYKQNNVNQLMGTLPKVRVTAAKPFSKVAVDYAGPIILLTKRGRGAKTLKGYICVFVDMVIKAVHLEAVSDLTTEALIMALKRFTGRRGLPTYIRSDNGSNFIGAARKLKEVYQLINSTKHNETVSDYLATNRVHWEFSPPAAPHFNGLVEAAVKSMKFHLNRIMQETHLTFDEMSTLLCQIEGILNSRPLCVSGDDADNYVLTPGHFLTMGELHALPEPSLDDTSMPTAKRWKQVQSKVNGFWKRFYSEYLTTLQQRHKWCTKQPNLAVGDLVLLKEDNIQPGKWPRGRIVKLHRGSDDLVRVVTIKTSNSTLTRAVHKLIQLPVE